MSLKTIEQAKQNKIFKPLDLIVYALLVLVIGGLFLSAFLINRSAGEITGLEIRVKGKQVAVFSYEEKKLAVTANFDGSCQCAESEDGYVVTILTGEEGKNILFIPKGKGKVVMKEANCSTDKDCTYMSIAQPMDSIICIPHSLVIVATTDKLFIPDIIV